VLRWLLEVMNTVTLVAERRGRILGFLYATPGEGFGPDHVLAVLSGLCLLGTSLCHCRVT
jgi:hypothetical protein